MENLLHLLGEVEVVFGLWAGIFVLYLAILFPGMPEKYLTSLNFTEPTFVFIIMVVAATRPILETAASLVDFVARALPLPKAAAFYLVTLTLGPLLGSVITEPAAMTVTASLLLDRFYKRDLSSHFKYATLGLLFVNVSIGGVLTPYAAPPVLMVASIWKWDLHFMLANFGWKAVVACSVSTMLATALFYRELKDISWKKTTATALPIPIWVKLVHLLGLGLIVMNHTSSVLSMGIFLFFLGLVTVTREYQTELKLKEGLLVAFFLGGLVVLGASQRWWLEPILTQMESFKLFIGATVLTAVTDNAALTYLGAQVPNLSDASKYALVAGAVTGGGLTVIANAPNPAGYGLLNPQFGSEGISPLKLFLYALPPTIVAAVCFWFL